MPILSHPILERLSAADAALSVCINRANRRRGIRLFFSGISRLGDGVFWYLLMAAMLLRWHAAALPAVLHMVGAGLAGLLAYKYLKARILRPRPCDWHPDILRSTAPLDKFSFPSGHTLHALAFATVALHYYPILAPVVLPFATLVALSRLVLGLHYPSDVLVGALLGWAIATFSILVV